MRTVTAQTQEFTVRRKTRDAEGNESIVTRTYCTTPHNTRLSRNQSDALHARLRRIQKRRRNGR